MRNVRVPISVAAEAIEELGPIQKSINCRQTCWHVIEDGTVSFAIDDTGVLTGRAYDWFYNRVHARPTLLRTYRPRYPVLSAMLQISLAVRLLTVHGCGEEKIDTPFATTHIRECGSLVFYHNSNYAKANGSYAEALVEHFDINPTDNNLLARFTWPVDVREGRWRARSRSTAL